VIALYLNMFVLVVQLFQKVPALKELAPTQSEPPFQIAQLVVLVVFVLLGVQAARKFHGEPLHMPKARQLGPEGEGTGLIWRRFEERDGGVYVEVEAIALSRDVPASLRWLVEPT